MKYIKTIYKVIIFILIPGIIISCSSGNSLQDIKNVDAEYIKRMVNLNSDRLRSLDSEGNINIDTPEMNNSGSFNLSIQKPDSLYIYLQGPLGISLAQILLTRKNFIYYNIFDNVVYKGSSTTTNLKIIMKIDLGFDDMINAFSGKFHFSDTSSKNDSVYTEKDNYIIINNDKNKNEINKYWVDNENFYVKKYIKINNQGKIILDIDYSDYFKSDDIYFPNEISISKPLNNQSLWIKVTNKSFNNDFLKYKLKISKNAKLIEWD